MSRRTRWLLALSPWLAVVALLWREQQLEAALEEFVRSAGDQINTAVDGLAAQAGDAMSESAARDASRN